MSQQKYVTVICINSPDAPLDDDVFYEHYFRSKAINGERLKPLEKPCHDCAIVCNFYTPYSDKLAKQPIDVQVEASLRWFCHNNPERSCRGNIDRLSLNDAILRQCP